MSRDRLYSTQAVVLKRTDFGEADRLLTIYTPSHGKCRVIAKGVRKLTSRKAGHLELFTQSQLLLAKGRSLDIVTQAETINAFPLLRADLARTSRAYYAAELLDRFCEEGVENYPIFELFTTVLGWLNSQANLDLAVRFYELHLLDLLGYRPQLFHCAMCRAVIRPERNYFSPSEGGVLCPLCAERTGLGIPIEVNPLKVLRYLQTHADTACHQLRVGPEISQDMEEYMLRYIAYYLERNLKSIEFIKLLRDRDRHDALNRAQTSPPLGGEISES